MSVKTKIQWTDRTWSPVRGCSLVSAGCENCYAMKQAHRFSGKGQPYEGLTELGPHGPRWTGKVTLVQKGLEEPLYWRKPQRIFVNSMSDLFHEDVPEYFIFQVLTTIWKCKQHTFQVLTKRPYRMSAVMERYYKWIQRNPLENLWIGVSVENQATADERIPLLLQTPAAVRFVSVEPLLGPVEIKWWLQQKMLGPGILNGAAWQKSEYEKLDWVIVGGESGPGARPMHPDWARSIREQCKSAGVPYFFKQWGQYKPISEMPEAEHNALYVSNRTAKEHEDQDVLDEVYGSRCKVPSLAIRYDGKAFDGCEDGAWELRDGHPSMLTFKVGKKLAGEMLDGREHKEWPR